MVKYTDMNHDAEEIFQVFNLTEEEGHRVKYAIAFESFKGCMMTDELYPEPEDAPRTLTTKSGCLERCYQHIDTVAQKELLLFCFLEYHEKWIDRYRTFSRIPKKLAEIEEEFRSKDDDEMSEFEKEAKIMIIKLMQAKAKNETRGVQHVIDCIRKAKYDFAKFVELYDSDEKDDDIEDLINKALGKDEKDNDDEKLF